MSDIQSLNISFKTKDPEIFLTALNDIYKENYEGLSYKNSFFSNEDSLLNSSDKIRRCFSYDRIDLAEFQLNINTFKKSKENNSNFTANTLSTNFMSKENSEKFSKFESIDSINSSSLGFSLEGNESYGDKKTLQKSKLENIISQNLIVSDETLKIIIVGDKFTGKTTFVDNFCEGKILSERYEETPR
jgi:hypothetical protein